VNTDLQHRASRSRSNEALPAATLSGDIVATIDREISTMATRIGERNSAVMQSGRDGHGRFILGSNGGPGRPKGAIGSARASLKRTPNPEERRLWLQLAEACEAFAKEIEMLQKSNGSTR
jgi:hypothetical protein